FGVGADAAGECRRDGNVPVQDLLRLMGVADLENAALPGKADAFAVHFLLEVMHAEDAELATLGDLGKTGQHRLKRSRAGTGDERRVHDRGTIAETKSA